ncbi:hypothetical protein A3Q40_02935 [Rhodococcus sp. PBTS 1]|nr:hypothetical protein A3Q40_02935 [Rhodococcus sp. PBTS 1]
MSGERARTATVDGYGRYSLRCPWGAGSIVLAVRAAGSIVS